MNRILVSTTDIAHSNIAVGIFCVTTQDIFQVHLASIQLFFGRSLAFGGKVRTAQGFVGQSAYRAVRTVKDNRSAAGFAQRNFVVQTEINFASRQGFGLNVAIGTGVSNGVAQVDFFRRPFISGNNQTFLQLFAHLIQGFLNRTDSGIFRAVRFSYGERGRSHFTRYRVDCCVQCGCNRFKLLDIYRVGIRSAFGDVGGFVAAVVQTRLGQGNRSVCCAIGNSQSVAVQHAVADRDFIESNVV